VIEAPDPHGMVATSSPNMCNVIDIIHMLYVHIDPPSSCCYHCNDWFRFGKLEEQHQLVLCVKIYGNRVIEAPDPHGMIPTSSPNMCNVIDIIHKSRIYLSWSYHCSYYWFRFEKSAKIIKLCSASSVMIMECLRLQTHMEWLQHPLQTSAMWFTPFIWCGCPSWSYHCNHWFRFEKSAIKIVS
jgi:hypothetical protein